MAVLQSDNLWGDPVLLGESSIGSEAEEEADDTDVAVCGGEMKRRRSCGTDDEPEEGVERAGKRGCEPAVPTDSPEALLRSLLYRRGSLWELTLAQKVEREGKEKTHLGELTSAPASMSIRTTSSLPELAPACIGRTPQMTELMGWPAERAYWTSPARKERSVSPLLRYKQCWKHSILPLCSPSLTSVVCSLPSLCTFTASSPPCEIAREGKRNAPVLPFAAAECSARSTKSLVTPSRDSCLQTDPPTVERRRCLLPPPVLPFDEVVER